MSVEVPAELPNWALPEARNSPPTVIPDLATTAAFAISVSLAAVPIVALPNTVSCTASAVPRLLLPDTIKSSAVTLARLLLPNTSRSSATALASELLLVTVSWFENRLLNLAGAVASSGDCTTTVPVLKMMMSPAVPNWLVPKMWMKEKGFAAVAETVPAAMVMLPPTLLAVVLLVLPASRLSEPADTSQFGYSGVEVSFMDCKTCLWCTAKVLLLPAPCLSYAAGTA